MKKLFITTIICAGVALYSCKNDNSGQGNDPNALTEAKGGKYYGGIFTLNESEYIKNLFPLNITDAVSYRVSSQVYEGLMKFDQKDLSITKSLAESFETDATNTIYTFKIKKGVMFHDDECFPGGKGREMTTEDIKYCFTRLCTQDVNNQGFAATFQNLVKGADEYYAATKDGNKPNFEIEGIKVIDKYTIQITLLKPSSIFLYNLARPYTFIFAKEAFEKYGLDMRTKAVGTGPFTISSIEDGITIILKKNAAYHGVDADGNKLPYLSGIRVKFLKDKKTELLEFKKGNLDMMYRLPTDYIIEILEEVTKKKGDYGQYELQRTPEMAVHFLSFHNAGKVFSNKDLRKAFSFAVDRKKILDYVLNGEGYYQGIYGITPIDVFNGYDAKSIKGYDLNVDSAKYYLKKSGYRDGKDLPKITLELNSDGERNVAVAEEVKKQLKDNLNVDIELNVVTTAQLVENMINGKTDFFRVGWIADYPSPENFLWYLYGKNVPSSQASPSYPNMARYRNAKFDELYEAGVKATDAQESLKYYLAAEKVAMADAPIIVLWYDEGYRLMQTKVKNFPNNAMQFRDFTAVYFEPEKKATN